MARLAVLDTNSVIHLLGAENHLPAVDQYVISVITDLELLSYPLITDDEELSIRNFLSAVPIVELTTEIKHATVAVRRQHRLKLPDAIIIGTAVALGAGLITNDARLLRAGLPLPFVEAPELRP